MEDREERAGDLLYRYIEEVKSSETPEAANFVLRTSLDPAECAPLLPLVDALDDEHRSDVGHSSGKVAARARLMEAIRSDAMQQPVHKRIASRSVWLRALHVAALLTLIALAVVVIGLEARNLYRQACGSGNGGAHSERASR